MLNLPATKLLEDLNYNLIQGDLSIEISHLSFNSRKVFSKTAFFCLIGEREDGHTYISQAIEAGATLIIADVSRQETVSQLLTKYPTTTLCLIQDVKEALAICSARFFGNLSSGTGPPYLTAVTGTNGKTTCTYVIAQLLSEIAAKPVGLMGTLGNKVYAPAQSVINLAQEESLTTCQAPQLQKIIYQLHSKYLCQEITLEASSHALDQKRVHGCEFVAALFTNLTQDHLDYHLNMENYFHAKAKLFEMILPNGIAAINFDDPWGQKLLALQKNKTITYGINDSKADIFAEDVQISSTGTKCLLHSPWGRGDMFIPLQGHFNLYNVLGVLATILFRYPALLDKVLESLKNVSAAEGRFQVMQKQNFPTCIIDYAHTPDGLQKVLSTARQIVPDGARLICVFGCGGDRDISKRPLMGKISAQLADHSIITSDNPRSEDPVQIAADILSGIDSLSTVEVELDRVQAIQKTLSQANEQDVIVLAGKGHENYQILADRTIDLDDREEVLKFYGKS